MPTNQVTRNWGAIQIKSIDPYADVASDITSRLTKIIGTNNAFIRGFDLIKYYTDLDYDGIIVQLGPGIAVISNIVIEITEATTVRLASFPIPLMDDYQICLEYIYQKISPPPTAVIKGMRIGEVDDRIHLPLYTFRLNGWTSFINNETFMTWMNSNKEYLKDERHKTGYMLRSGGTVYGSLKIDKRITDTIDDNELVTREFVEKTINRALGTLGDEIDDSVGILSRYVRKVGDTLTGPLYSHEDVPLVHNQQFVTKKFVEDYAINKREGIVLGKLLLSRNPLEPSEAATKDYVDRSAQYAINNMTITMKHGDLSQLDSDHHKQYPLVNGRRGFNAPVEGVSPIVDNHLATKSYVDNQYKTMNTRLDNLVLDHNAPNSHSLLNDLTKDDHLQYAPINGSRSFTNPIAGVYPITNNHLSTKQYVDDVVYSVENKLSNRVDSLTTIVDNITNIVNNGGYGGSGFNPDLLKNIKHSDLLDRNNDDHPQYILTNGEREFTGPVQVPDPLSDNDAINKGFMKSYVETEINKITNLPSGTRYILSDGTIPFIAEIEGVAASKPNSFVTLSQMQSEFSGKISSHNTLNDRLVDDAHPQYLLLSGGTMTNTFKIVPPIEDEHPVTYKLYKDHNDIIEASCYWKYDTL